MDQEKLKKMTTGDAALAYVEILQLIVEQLINTMLEKNMLTKLEAKEIIENSINIQLIKLELINEEDDLENKERWLNICELGIEQWSMNNKDK